MKVDNKILREVFLKSNLRATDVAKEIGWISQGHGDGSRLKRTLGLLNDINGSKCCTIRQYINIEIAEKIALAIGVDVHYATSISRPLKRKISQHKLDQLNNASKISADARKNRAIFQEEIIRTGMTIDKALLDPRSQSMKVSVLLGCFYSRASVDKTFEHLSLEPIIKVCELNDQMRDGIINAECIKLGRPKGSKSKTFKSKNKLKSAINKQTKCDNDFKKALKPKKVILHPEKPESREYRMNNQTMKQNAMERMKNGDWGGSATRAVKMLED